MPIEAWNGWIKDNTIHALIGPSHDTGCVMFLARTKTSSLILTNLKYKQVFLDFHNNTLKADPNPSPNSKQNPKHNIKN
jgi:hypothetical protein